MTLAIVIRPEPGCSATVAAASRLGMAAQGFAMAAAVPLAWAAPPPGEVDALLIGSANALRHGGTALQGFHGFPAYAVGAATAAAAMRAGLGVVATGTQGLQEIVARIDPGHRRLLRLCGRERTTLTVPPSLTLSERVVYETRPLAMPATLAGLLARQAPGETLVLLHSAGAARHFAAECDRLALVRAHLRLAALSPRVAAAAGTGWAAVAAAERPEDAALLALALRMCHKPEYSTRRAPHRE
ncbi:MAG: uroporphyrinogen-III synthase [Sphingomonadales bacterium]|nr:uroporphyrinogen-III synthase [Sphingomonadales bacterium]